MGVPFLSAIHRVVALKSAETFSTYGKRACSPEAEKRSRDRRRTRLRTGKVLDARNRFIIECTVHDRSPQGARIRLLRTVEVPQTLRLYDDERQTLTTASIIWRRNLEIGLCFLWETGESRIKITELEALARRYYAI
jgi:hypothetical protein